ncbi:MAG: 3-hydroxyacyl-ACP dehydratase FabZ [Candidatus Bostrichicola ureolyticus]|nr:MAG: 3-hydroxyacyl-ACP dehydratase FabZ [Candidatus Bostrichicola ureolyticus]
MIKKQKITFDIKKTIYDINYILSILPHKQPFIFVDKIIESTDNHVVGIKAVTINEPFFVGHFPNEPIMPGVLLIEAIAQVGCIFVLSKVDDPKKYYTYLLKIDKTKFKKKVVPGDIIIFKLNLLKPIRRNIINMHGYGYVNNNIVVETELIAKISKI